MRGGSPKYHQIADQLRAQILAGELEEGAQLPGEIELMTSFDVSRSTIRLALKRLTDEGLLQSDQGRGTFVRGRYKPFEWNWSTLESRSRHITSRSGQDQDQWATSVIEAGRVPHQDISVSIVNPPPAVVDRLGLDPETGVAVLRRRVRFVDREPYLLADSYFPVDLVQGTLLMAPRDVSAPGGVLASAGLVQVRYHDEIVPRMPTRREIEMLRLPAATPVAEHTRTGYDKDDRALRVMVTVLPGDRHILTYDVHAD